MRRHNTVRQRGGHHFCFSAHQQLVLELARGTHGAGCLPGALPPATRIARAQAARSWLSALALANNVRPLVLRAAEHGAGEPIDLRDALSSVIQVTAPHLDRATAGELQALLRELVP